MEAFWGTILINISYDVAPKAGHWLGRLLAMPWSYSWVSADRDAGDENPQWSADRLLSFFAENEGIPSVDLSYLKDKVTLV